jgi:hypothetical protein
MITRNGVCLDLTKSVYKYKAPDSNITFVFSSDLHLTKFEEQYKEHRKEFNLKFTARFRLTVDMKILPDVLLYKKIETRGFLIIDEGGKRIWQENLLLTGEKATPKS